MKLKLVATQNNVPVHEGTYPVDDARSFGDACADMWIKLAQDNLSAASNIGTVYEALGDHTLPDLRGVQFRFEPADP